VTHVEPWLTEQLVNGPWKPADTGFFTNGPTRIRKEKLSCLLGGSRHTYEDWGEDIINAGLLGIVPAIVKVCHWKNCRHTTRKRIKEGSRG